MTYKTILAIIQDAADAERVLDHAIPLATRMGAHLTGVHAEPMAIPYSTAAGFPDAEFVQASSEASQKRSQTLEALFRERCGDGLSIEWQSHETMSGDSALCALSLARCADLVIAAQTDPAHRSAITANVDHLLFETGRPALFVPFAGPVRTKFAKILVAWNGTREASRAAFDALPFIREADETEIRTVDPPEPSGDRRDVAGAEIAAALTRHGARIGVASARSAGLDVSAVIENHAVDVGADLLVMGAYGHSRLREYLFGGVTRTVLRSMPIATFMSR